MARQIQEAFMKTLISLENLCHEEWIKSRRKGIGSSDAASILGINPWKSAIQLWGEKTGLIEEADLSENEAVEWGIELEDLIARKYARVTKRELERPTHIYRHSEHEWMLGNPDRFIVGDPRGMGILEIKTTGAHHTADWEEEAPEYYQVQLQHLLAVTGLSWGSFAVLIGGQKFRWMDVLRNDNFITFLISKEEAFWDCVLTGRAPDPDASESARKALALIYPEEKSEECIDLPEGASQWADEIDRGKELIKEGKALLLRGENMMKAAIGNASIGKLSDGRAYSWKVQHRDGYAVPPSDYRVLREIKFKGGK